MVPIYMSRVLSESAVKRVIAFLSLAEDFQQELSVGLGQGDEAELIDNEQLETGQLLLKVEQASLIHGLDQFMDQCGSGGEADRQPPLTGGKSQTEGDVSLAGTAVTHGDNVLVSFNVLVLSWRYITDGEGEQRRFILLEAGDLLRLWPAHRCGWGLEQDVLYVGRLDSAQEGRFDGPVVPDLVGCRI